MTISLSHSASSNNITVASAPLYSTFATEPRKWEKGYSAWKSRRKSRVNSKRKTSLLPWATRCAHRFWRSYFSSRQSFNRWAPCLSTSLESLKASNTVISYWLRCSSCSPSLKIYLIFACSKLANSVYVANLSTLSTFWSSSSAYSVLKSS